DVTSGLVAVVVSGLLVLVDEDPDGGQGPNRGHGGKNHLGEDGPPALHQDLIAGPDRHLRGPGLWMVKVQAHLRVSSVGAAAQKSHSVQAAELRGTAGVRDRFSD